MVISSVAVAKLVLVSAGVLINGEGHVLLAQRPPGKNLEGKWEFPGGKLEAGEGPEDALVRELDEELGIKVRSDDLEPLTFASHRYDRFHLLMPVFLCRHWLGEIVAKEHTALAWVQVQDMLKYPLAPADIPLVPVLRDRLKVV